MTNQLTGKVAIVTGASSGIGEATALALADKGATVAIAARRRDRLDDLAQRITEKGGQVLAITADVSDETQVVDMVEQTQTKFGKVDILVNNAGVMLLGMIDGANTEDWRRMVNLNVLGLMYATHKVLPLMKAQSSSNSKFDTIWAFQRFLLRLASISSGCSIDLTNQRKFAS